MGGWCQTFCGKVHYPTFLIPCRGRNKKVSGGLSCCRRDLLRFWKVPSAIESCHPLPWAAVHHVHLGPSLLLFLQAQGTHRGHEWQHLSGMGSPGSEGIHFLVCKSLLRSVWSVLSAQWNEWRLRGPRLPESLSLFLYIFIFIFIFKV